MAENLEPQVPTQDKAKLLYDAVSKDYNIGTYDDFSKKLQDPIKRKAFYEGVGNEYNLGTFDDFSAKIGGVDLKKKDQIGVPISQAFGQASAPIGLALPSQKGNKPDFQKGLDIAQKGYMMPNAGGTEKQPEEGSLANFGRNLREKTVEKAADIDIAALKFLRNLSGKLPFANKPEEIYDESGNLTKYGQNIESSDFLGRAIKSFKETQDKERELQQTEGKLPETAAGQIAEGVTGIAPDMALALMTGGKNLFGGTSRLAALGNALTGAFVREQAVVGGARGYNESDGKDVGETLGNVIKEGGKDVGQAMLFEAAGFGGGKIGNALSKPFKNTTAKGAVNLAARLATFSLGVPNAQSLIEKGELASEDEVLKNLGIAGVMEAFHGTLHGAGKAVGKAAEKVAENKYIADLKKVNDIRAGAAIQNFMKASPDVIDNLVKSEQTAQNLNLAAMDAVKRAEGMEDGAEKSQLLKTASNLTQAADIKHVTDVIANSTDGLAHIAKDIPEEVRDAFMQKAQDIHQTLNPTELQKQGHAANISQAEEIAKQVEPLAKPENPNVLERIQAERKLNEAKGVIDENTKNLNKVLDEQEKRNQQIQETKLAEEGSKKYVVDGKEVSQEEFEAMQDKPVGTKEIINQEVDIEKRRQNDLGNLKKGIPAMITKKLESDLKQYGFTDQQINKMTPIVANESLINAKYDAELAALKEAKPTEVTEEIKIEQPTSTQKVKIPGTKQSKPIPLSDFTLEKEGEKSFTKRVKKDEGGVSGVEPLNQFKLNQGMDAYGDPYPKVHIILDEADALKYQAGFMGNDGKKKYKNIEFRDEINKIAKANRSKDEEIVLDFRKSEIDALQKLKTKENAIQEPSTGEILQRPQEGVGETRGERPRVEPSVKGTETTKESEQTKINEEKVEGRTPQVKPLSEFKVGDKFVFATDRDGSERTIVSINDGIVSYKNKGSKEVSSASEIQRLGNDLALSKSDWDKGIRPNKSEFEGSRFKSKVKPTEKQINNLTKELLRVNYTGDDLNAKTKGQPGKAGYVQSAEDSYREIAKRYLENDLDIVEVIDDLHGGKERLQEIINGEYPKKTYQEALKEKQEADKKQTRQAAGEKAAVTRKIFEEANKIEASDARSAALQFLAGANLSQDAINEIAGNVKRAQLNTGRRELKTQEARSRDYVAKKGEGQSLDEAAHSIWDNMSEEMQSKNTTQDVKEALMQAVLEHKTKAAAANALIEGYKEEDIEEQMNKHYERFANENPEKMEEEMAKLEESMSKLEEDDNYEFDYPEEHINNLIDQYEKESETKIEQPTEGDKGKGNEKVSSGEIKPEDEREAEATIITHAANAETRERLGLEQPELLSNLTDKERYEKAEKMLNKGYDINKLIDKMYNPEEVLNPVENAISNLYKQSLLSEIEKNPSDANLALAKRFLDARDQANSRAGATLQSLKGEGPKTILDFYVNKMEDNNTDILTDKQKEEAKKEYEAIKAKLDIVEAKNKELEKLNSELLAQKAIDEQKGIKKTTTKEKRDYTAERKEVIDSIKEKLKKARTGQNGLTAVPVPYAKELFEIAPDVAKLVKLYVEEGAGKLEEVVNKIYEVLKDEIKGLQKKDVQDVIAGEYSKPNKAKPEIERKINDLKTEAKLINQIEDARQLKPKTEKAKVEQNKTLTDLRKELNKVRKETGYYDESKLKSLIERNKKETQSLKEKLEKGDFSEKEKAISFIENKEIKEKYPELYKEYLDAVDAKDEQQHEYELKRAVEQMNALSKTERYKAQATKFVKEGFSTVKALKAGVDNSAVFVQNGIAVMNPMNYKATGKALVAQTQDLFSERRFRRRIVEVHENKPLWNLIETSGLDYLDPKGYNRAMRDEQFGSTNWLERKIKIGDKEIQIAKYTTAPFERLFTSFSNEFRLQIFLRGAEQLAKEGKTIESHPKEYKDLASYVNTITGRGKIHEGLASSENAISNVIWAPKLLSSTLNLMGAGDLIHLGKNKGYYREMTPQMRKYALTQTAAGIGTGIALMAAYSLLPNKEVDFDPESVTFGQVKDTETGWGYTIFGRLTPVIRYIAMMTMGIKKVGEGKPQTVDPLKETYKFIRGKMAPTAGIVTDVMMRKDFSGKPYKLSNVPGDLFEPLFINDLRKQLAVDGTSTLLTKGIPAFYGLKVSNEKMYDKRDLPSLLETVDSSTMDKNSLFNYDENRLVNNIEYKQFVNKRDNILKELYKNISENGVPVVNANGVAEILPIDSKQLTKDLFTKEINRLKGLATRNAKKELFGLKELTDEQLDAKDALTDLRDKQGIGNQEEEQ